MKKEYLDFLYETRAVIQERITHLEELGRNPKDGNCQNCGDPIRSELDATRKHIQTINLSIEQYLEVHQ